MGVLFHPIWHLASPGWSLAGLCGRLTHPTTESDGPKQAPGKAGLDWREA
ncbi:hypothetical protein SAMN05216174_1295 [Actinokineospora iranica]|uniref:Uncharacterized protein n=1 Tax=Actinokineospora iranica TaxID=1271860 RepID=A0A1G6ZE99_9PSEU|nr:hypothetical protein SAMN05216174_1295 [Actinokineospora iranica]